MGVNDAIRAYNGVVNWINKQNNLNLPQPKNKSYKQHDINFNNILIQFGKENNIKMERNNKPKYKGNYNPGMSNCIEVQNNWKLFKEWIIKKYTK